WTEYNKRAKDADGEMLKGLNGTLDVLLLFAGLFSAVVTAFVVQSLQVLSPNYAQITASILWAQGGAAAVGAWTHSSHCLSPSSAIPSPGPPLHGSPVTDVWVNGLWLTSLCLALFTSLLSVLAKQ
ncbi:hypothetical protein GGF50DRAFT_26346, partial [Schizophyllum commune]